MDSLYYNTTTYNSNELFRNDSMNNSVHEISNTTNSFSSWNKDMFDFIMYTVVRVPMCVIGFIANIICYNVLKADSGKKHHAATLLLQALAVADNLLLTFYLFSSIIVGLRPMLSARDQITFNMILMYVRVYVAPFANMALAATVWITVLIAINRYIAVCWPLNAPRLASLKNTKIQVAVVFTIAIIFTLPRFFQYTLVYPENDDSKIVPSLIVTRIGPRTAFGVVYNIVIYSLTLILPLILLIILNSKIIWELRKANKQKDAIRQKGRRSKNNITVVMVVIVIMFIVCTIPYLIHLVAWYTHHRSVGWSIFYSVSQLLLLTNSSMNFVVYYVLRRSFRRAFRKSVPCYQSQASHPGSVDECGHSTAVSLTPW